MRLVKGVEKVGREGEISQRISFGFESKSSSRGTIVLRSYGFAKS